MEITPKEVLQALSVVIDPDFKKDIVTLGMVRHINIEGNKLSFDLVLTTPACPLKDMLEKGCRDAIRDRLSPDFIVDINVTSEVRKNIFMQGTLDGVKNVIAVASGKGGVGKSTVSLSLAKVLAESGAKVGLMDADIYGPSQPTLTGTESYKPTGVQGKDKNLMKAAEVGGLKVFSIGYLVEPGVAVAWRGPMMSTALRQFVSDVAWGELDYLIIDLPPGTGDAQLTLCAALKITGVVIVTTPQKVAMVDADRALQMFRMKGLTVPILGIIENMAWFETPELPNRKFYIFGDSAAKQLSEQSGVPLLGSVPIIENLSSDQNKGSIIENNPVLPYFKEIVGNLVRNLAIQTQHIQEAQTS
ncbi:MAG: Mrp/NBP35 family ATP-binding protein [Bacteroidia bacterium]|nr:Mrp/NBP35 family ATP-binding protein [Bacteroidia bacterium]